MEYSILGIDLALRRTGYAYLAGTREMAEIRETGIIEAKGKQDVALAHIAVVVQGLLSRLNPGIVYVEVPGRMNRNTGRSIKTVIALSEALGIVKAVCATAGIRIVEIPQEHVKEMLVGYSKASKQSVASVLTHCASSGNLAGLGNFRLARGALDMDIYDAVGVAWAGIMREDYERTISKAN